MESALGRLPSAFIRRGESALPRLEILPLTRILYHEELDPARAAGLSQRLEADGMLRNPPIVARSGSSLGTRARRAPRAGPDRGEHDQREPARPEKGQRLLLDGANRIAALARLGLPHALVQTEALSDPALRLSHWNHVVGPEVGEELVSHPPGELALGPAGTETPGAPPVACLLGPDGSETEFWGPRSPAARARALCSLVARYADPGARLGRVTDRDLPEARRAHPGFGGIVCFPDLEKEEILRIAEAGIRLPSGITRILVPRRVLGLNVPLSFLAAKLPVRQKQRRLEALLLDRVRSGTVRHYAEPVVVFDD